MKTSKVADLTGYDFQSLYPNTKELSSSQVLLYECEPEKFYIEYVLGVRREQSTAMLVGSIFSELHKNRQYDFRSALVQAHATRRYADIFARVIKRFPAVPAEIPIRCEYKGWTFRASLDGFPESAEVIIENKTGQTVWTQERADVSDQITFQAWVYWKIKNKPPKFIILNWVDLRAKTTKELVSYKTKRTVKHLREFEKRIDRVIESIEMENWTVPLRQKIYNPTNH